MSSSADHIPPAASTFSFTAPSSPALTPPLSALKQRRVSLALPSSPRLVQAWSFRDDTGIDSHTAGGSTRRGGLVPEKRGKMRKIASGSDSAAPLHDDPADEAAAGIFQEKKQRKKWTQEETQMLVDGCNRHGVGNWKTILSDPTLTFDNRSPVDLKDRFRTYFPDAYKQHYPNARTHLSSKVRSTLPDGSSLFEKTRSKKRRPFTEEEDRALKAGYEKHGTIWATIVKDPVFQEQGRRSTDLRDRFRNAFPELYQAAGYKPRNASKKKVAAGLGIGADNAVLSTVGHVRVRARAATDDQLAMSTTGPVRSRRRAHTSQGLLRGGTKSVPQSTACSEDEDSSAGEEEGESVFKMPQTPVFVDNVSTASLRAGHGRRKSTAGGPFVADDDDEMEMVTLDALSDPLAIPDFMPSSHAQSHAEMDTQSQTWSSGIDTPVHSSHHAWSTAAGSPTSSHLSADLLMNSSSHSSPFHRFSDSMGTGGMIGKSAWGTQDWFSANPRLDPSSASASASNNSSASASSYLDSHPSGPGLGPSSPFSFHNLNHGVLDRYDLFPPASFAAAHDFSSEVGAGDSHSTFSDELFPPSGFRGFTHHSSYAGDLIFGARTHQPASQQGFYGSGFGFGGAAQGLGLGLGGLGLGLGGLGLEGLSQSAGIHPMQLHTPALPGIDEIELAGINLNDHGDGQRGDADAMEESDDAGRRRQGLRGQAQEERGKDEPQDRFSLDDLVNLQDQDQDQDIDELHATPPGTPLMQSRTMRRMGSQGLGSGSGVHQYSATHGRSISVPPSEARASFSRPPPQTHPNSQPDMAAARSLPFFTSVRLQQQGSLGPHHGVGGAVHAKNTPASTHTTAVNTPHKTPLPPPSSFPLQLLPPSTSHPLSSAHDAWRMPVPSPGDLYDLPFLDLHYYGHHSSSSSISIDGPGMDGMASEASAQSTRQGQALDLAQTAASNHHHHHHSGGAGRGHVIPQYGAGNGMGKGPSGAGAGSPPVPVSGSSGNGVDVATMAPGNRSHSNHHRGQSAVCPQDLMLRNDNKRKRASWDGGHL